MAEFRLPRPIPEPMTRLPRLTVPGVGLNDQSQSAIAGYLKRLPAQTGGGTDTYQAGIDQSTGGDMRRAYGDMRAQEQALAAQQATALQAHKDYHDKLQATQMQVNTRNNDLKLAQNMLIATDPNADKSVRKFMLQGLSNASGVDPKGEYSKNLQTMILGMSPDSLEALRSTFGSDIRTAPPGSIQQTLNGLFSGKVPLENVIGQVKQHQEAQAAAGSAASAPGLPLTTGASASGAAPLPDAPSGVDVATAAAGEAAGGGASITPAAPIQSTPSAPTAPVQSATDNTSDPAEAARLLQAAMSESSTGAEPPPTPPEPDIPSPDVAAAPEAAAASPEAAAAGVTPQTAAPFSKIDIPQHWRDAAEKSGDKLAQDIIAKIDQRNAVIDSSQYTPPAEAGAAAPSGTPPPASAKATTATAPDQRSITQKIADALGMSPSGPFRSDYKSTTEPVAPGAAEGAAAATTTDRPVVDPKTGQELPSSPGTTREQFNQSVAEYNTKVAQEPVAKTPNLQYVKPDDREMGERPVPPSMQNNLPGVDKTQQYSFNHLKEIYPLLDDSTEYKKEFAKRAENAKDATREVLDSNMDLANLINIAQKAKTLGGLDASLKTPWGSFDLGKITPGTAARLAEGVKDWFNTETKVTPDQFSGIRDEAQKYAAKQLANTNLSNEDKAVLQTMLEAGFYRSAVSFARANNNGGKQISNQDMQIGLKMAGDVNLTGAANIALTKTNTDRSMKQATNEFGQFVGQPNMPANFDSMSSKDRQELMNKHFNLQKDGDKSPLSPEMFKQLAQAEVDYQSQRRGGPATDPNRFIQRTGNTEEDYRVAQQKNLSVEEARKAAVEERAKIAQELSIESHKLAQQRYQDQLAHQARQEAQHRQDKLQAAFQHIGAMVAGSVKGVSMPQIGGGDSQDTSAFRMTPAPQRVAPRVGAAQAPQRALPQINVRGGR